jgi:hypothetical protein
MLSRVLVLHTAEGPGVGFFVDHGKRQWLVTAAHLVPEDPIVEVDLVLPGGRSRTALPRLAMVPGAAEVAVFELEEPVVPRDASIEASNGGLLMGQDVHLFGYPLMGYGAWGTETGAALPFVRRGCMAATMSLEGTRTLLIDAISDPGMAGGPVTFLHDRNGKPHIAGVIIDPHAAPDLTEDDRRPRFPLGVTQVVSIDHVTETIDARKRR